MTIKSSFVFLSMSKLTISEHTYRFVRAVPFLSSAPLTRTKAEGRKIVPFCGKLFRFEKKQTCFSKCGGNPLPQTKC